MAATNTSDAKFKQFVGRLRKDYPQFSFRSGKSEHWSPKSNTINFRQKQPSKELGYSLLHELAHALLEHKNYSSDLELLKMEAEAWQLAAKLGRKYNVKISDNHIQNCLDTYRDWLHKRSLCPSCDTHVIQQSANTYRCFNCGKVWRVSSGRFVRPYRLANLKRLTLARVLTNKQ